MGHANSCRRVRPGATGWLALVGLAFAGVVAGHGATYRLLLPSSALRHRLLVETGHAHWNQVAAVAAGVGVLAAVVVVLRALRADRDAEPPGGWGGWLRRLAAVQAALFAGLELAERALVTAPAGGLRYLLPLGVLLPVGVAVQVAVAGVTARLLHVAVGCASTLARRLSRRAAAPPTPRLSRPLRTRPLDSLRNEGAWGVRGPPQPAR